MTDGRPSRGRAALALIAGAKEDGLEPADYGVEALERLASIVSQDMPARRDTVARLDVGLSAALIHYLQELRQGRVDSRTLGFRLGAAPPLDLGARLADATTVDRLRALAREMWPPFSQYRLLRAALGHYRQLATRTLTPIDSGRSATVEPGAVFPQREALARWLSATGDLASDAPMSGEIYDKVLVDGVKRFQTRHGLATDGIIGPRTRLALRITPAERVRQIELAMERLRALPDLTGQRTVAVNIPTFQAWAWDAPMVDPTPRLAMKVIVGQATRTATPAFIAEMRQVIFRPSWDVPPSIARHELIPLIKNNRGYLDAAHFDVVARDGRVIAPPLDDTLLAKLQAGEYRLRQRPGPDNALGLIKFVFANDAGIYMHGTPAPGLFAAARRDFSHGCIRLEDPVGLAAWALEGMPGWSRARVVEAMEGTGTVTRTLETPVRLVIFYSTAIVDPADGLVHFAEDIYGHDAGLARALAARSRR